jgi:DNA polymerase III delta prime subunit
VIGNNENINLKFDEQAVNELLQKEADIIPLYQPTREELFRKIKDQQGWHIFFFTGHSDSDDKGEIGTLHINNYEDENESTITIKEISNAFEDAINNGLQLAIFNSCDGLGLAYQLAELNLPQSLVMREEIPDKVAQQFLKDFITNFSQGKSLPSSVLEARGNLQTLEKYYPGVCWLPVIYQNPGVIPFSWNKFQQQTQQELINVLSHRELKQRKEILSELTSNVKIGIKRSLHNAKMIVLDLDEQLAQVQCSPNFELNISNDFSKKLPKDTTIINVFDLPDISGKLLILGAPGSGKTTSLLNLAEQLIKRAEQNADHPIPVLFNLSSWQDEKQSIIQWLLSEIQEQYPTIEKDIVQKWIECRQILPLLDGLDELPFERQEKCVLAINQLMMSKEKPLHLIVCSRKEEYEAYNSKLILNGSVCLNPFDEKQIEEYLNSINHCNLLETIKQSPEIFDLVKSPLMLSIVTLSIDELSIDKWQNIKETEKRLNYLVYAFIRRMLRRKIKTRWYKNKETIYSFYNTLSWLTWMSKELLRENKTEFIIEKIQPQCLNHKFQIIIYHLGCTLLFILIFSLISFLIGGLQFGIISGLIFGIGFGLNPRFNEKIDLPKTDIHIFLNQQLLNYFLESLYMGLKWGIVGLATGLIFGFPFTGFFICLLMGWLTRGGIAYIQYLVLRIVLLLSNATPYNYYKFLNYATEKMLLQRIGRRYKFIHNFVRDSFAKMDNEIIREIEIELKLDQQE